MEEVLPQTYQYDKSLQVSASAEAHRITLTPTNGNSFVGRGRVIFQLPSGSTGMYFQPNRTFLQYSLRSTVVATTAFQVDASAYSPINEISVYFGSTRVSSITDAHILGNFMLDHMVSASDRGTSLGVYGCADFQHLTAAAVNGVVPLNTRNGRTMATAANSKLDFCIPLIGLFGPGNCLKAIPLSLLRDDIRIELTLNPVFNWVTGAPLAEGNVVAEDFKLQTEVIRLDSAVEQQIISSVPKGIMTIPATDFLCYSTVVNAGSGAISWLIPCRAKSVQAIYIVMSAVNNSTNIATKSSSTFTREGLTSYSFRLGGLRTPNIPVSTLPEMRSELYKSLRILNSNANASSITQAQYENGEAFAIGLSLDSFQHEGMILDGKSLASSSGVLFEATLSPSNVGITVFAYLQVDSILTVSDGLLDYSN